MQVFDHSRCRTYEVDFSENGRRTLRMRKHFDVFKLLLVIAHIISGESLMHLAVPFPENYLYLRLTGDITAQELIRQKYHAVGTQRFHYLDRIRGCAANVRLGLDRCR